MPGFSQTPADKFKLKETIAKTGKFNRPPTEKVKLKETLTKFSKTTKLPVDKIFLADNVTVNPTYGTGTVRIIYGGYEFLPSPLITFSRDLITDGLDHKLIERVTISCSGAIVLLTGVPTFGRLDTEKWTQLKNALSTNKNRLTITHENGYFLDNVYPRVEGFQTQEDVWVNKLRYSFNFVYEVPVSTTTNVESFTDNWDWSEGEDNQVQVTHTMSARGINTNTYKESNALINAKAFIATRTGVNNIPKTFPAQIAAIYGGVNDITFIRRLYTESVNRFDGSYNLTETFVLISGAGATYIHTRKFDYGLDENGLSTMGISGSILGQGTTAAERTEEALAGWAAIQQSLYEDAYEVYLELGGGRILSTNLLSQSVSKNPQLGAIDYSVSFGDKVNDPNADGITDSSFTISQKNPVAVFASIDIPGKADGPVWQDIQTVTEGEYTIEGRIIGETLDKAINYAQYLIQTYTGNGVGTRSRITSHQFTKNPSLNSVDFSITWAFLSQETVQELN